MDRAYSLEEISKWPKGNYDNPELYGHYLPAVETILLVCSSVAVILRVTARGIMTSSLGIDDIVILPAWGFAIAESIAHFQSLRYGWGRHMWDVDWRLASNILFWQWVNGWAFSFSVMFTKVSILCFYLRFASERSLRFLIYFVLAFFVAWSLGLVIPMIAQCRPVASTWDFMGSGDRKCISYWAYKKLNLAQGLVNLISDVILFCLPLPTVLAMRRPRKERAWLIGLFGLGLLVCVFAGLRLKAMYKTFSGDQSWYGYELWLWVSLEVHIGIIIASLPGIRLLCIIVFGKVPLFHAHEVESTLFSNPDLKITAHPAANGRTYYDDNVTVTTITAVDQSGNTDSLKEKSTTSSQPKMLQRLRLMSPKVPPYDDHRSVDKPEFDFDTQLSSVRPKSMNLSTLGTGDDFEEIAVPPPTFGGLLVYKNTEIHVTTESRDELEGIPRVMSPAPVIPHDVLASGWEHQAQHYNK
ncbi:hypothetical protein Dda_4244 [Drechslerella dactyloides]|uniref:Rhodopsin domain-containing protein n=1 Tax=Drechslerella dactyloides TaxID=74499 RepID=A0AAD6J0W7_DREDA|nr:hypothetical protein Dda_4244 [Drechslerella dactyloides]